MRHQVLPLYQEDHTLVVAMAEPLRRDRAGRSAAAHRSGGPRGCRQPPTDLGDDRAVLHGEDVPRHRRHADRGGRGGRHRDRRPAEDGPGGPGHQAGQPDPPPGDPGARLRHPHRAPRAGAAGALPGGRSAARRQLPSPPSAPRHHLPHQDHGDMDIAERRLPQDGRRGSSWPAARSTCASPPSRPCTARASSSVCSTARPGPSH